MTIGSRNLRSNLSDDEGDFVSILDSAVVAEVEGEVAVVVGGSKSGGIDGLSVGEKLNRWLVDVPVLLVKIGNGLISGG